MDYAAVVFIQVVNTAAFLFLISSGLAIVLGMMRIINIAHGEFIMLGAYVFLLSVQNGVNFWIAMFVVAPLALAVIGVLVERLLIRFLYDRLIDSLLATWGLSLFLSGGVAMLFGNAMEGVPTPFGALTIGRFSVAWYSLFVVAVALGLLAVIWMVLKLTRLGLVSRGVMQNPGMAATLGISPNVTYMVTFAAGAAMAGLAGAVLAPVTGIGPNIGSGFIAKSFVTVIGGGPAIIAGTASAAGAFGLVNQLVSFWQNSVWGDTAMLVGAVMMLRVLPNGITGRFMKGSI